MRIEGGSTYCRSKFNLWTDLTSNLLRSSASWVIGSPTFAASLGAWSVKTPITCWNLLIWTSTKALHNALADDRQPNSRFPPGRLQSSIADRKCGKHESPLWWHWPGVVESVSAVEAEPIVGTTTVVLGLPILWTPPVLLCSTVAWYGTSKSAYVWAKNSQSLFEMGPLRWK